jgi:outer membrane protein assembly factor BamB
MARLTRWSKHVSFSSALLALCLTACAGTSGAFAVRYPDNVETSLREMVRLGEAGASRTTPTIAAGVNKSGQLFAYDLASKRVLWQVSARSQFAPLLAGQSVVIQEGGRIVGMDLKTGSPRFQFDAGPQMLLVGADGDGDSCVITLTSGQGTFAKSRIVYVNGSTREWNHTLNSSVGVPALTGDVVLVPWNNQYLSGLYVKGGEEFARLRVREGVISHAFVSRGHVFVGSQHGIALLSTSILAGNLATGPHYDPPAEELPGRPQFLRDVYAVAPLPAPDSANSRVRLSWQSELSRGGQVALAGGNLYLLFYRFVFALDPRSLELRWVHTNDVDLVGARAESDGIVVADAHGALSYLAAGSGDPLWREQNGPGAVSFEFPPEQSAVGAADAASTPRVDLRKQLSTAASDPDSRLVPARLLAVQLLARLADPSATADLLLLCEDERTTIAVRKASCNALRERSVGNEHVLRALERHGSFLAATAAPPVGALAKAASVQKETRAAPLLIAHIRDPNTPTQGLPEAVQALGDLGDASAVLPLTQFLLLYHADPIDEHLARALSLVPAALVKLQGVAARDLLSRIVDDPLGAPTIRAAAQQAVAKIDEGPHGAEGQAVASAQPEAASAQPAEPESKVPQHITLDLIKQTLLPVHDTLQKCIRDAKPDVFQARVVLVVEDGQTLMVSVLPEQLQSCIEPLVRSQTFPVTQTSQRERVSYTIKRF